ncbi:EamA-like_transporter family protein [Hexamita inflata]|uniref:EamA-like transporter family protein n=1 Tax=Hexamita inflata TaxID=28002 RepID=A0AA86V2S3_9EUKA|nr:EamA-like transporter family protein [Hexamita inflata]CAI9973961.1 EamA-like transporter family protein [Hexamita inflata]
MQNSPLLNRVLCRCLHFRSVADGFIFGINLIVSIAMPLLNYYVFTKSFKAGPIVFTCLQFVFCGLVSLVVNMCLKLDKIPTCNSKITTKGHFWIKFLVFLLPGLIMGGNVTIMNMGLAKTSVTLQFLLKAPCSIYTLVLDRIFFKTKIPMSSIFMVFFMVAGSVLLGVAALSKKVKPDEAQAIGLLCFSAVISSVYLLLVKRCQTYLRKTKKIYIHPTEATFYTQFIAGVLMIFVSLGNEMPAWKIFFPTMRKTENYLLASFIAGCIFTTVDKLSSIYMQFRNTIIDMMIMQEARKLPTILLDILLNKKYGWNAYSISGGLLILVAEFVWALISPAKSVVGEGSEGLINSATTTSAQPENEMPEVNKQDQFQIERDGIIETIATTTEEVVTLAPAQEMNIQNMAI